MPIYEYGCNACGHQLEVQQKLSELPLKTCPRCGKRRLEKLISPTAFVLKGGGWYKDGYSGSSKRTDTQVGDRLGKAIADDKKDDKKKGGSGSSSSGSSSGGTAAGSGGATSSASGSSNATSAQAA